MTAGEAEVSMVTGRSAMRVIENCMVAVVKRLRL